MHSPADREPMNWSCLPVPCQTWKKKKTTGVHRGIYNLTDWLGLIPVFICIGFGGHGLFQLIKRRSLLKVDRDILLLGIYYILVILRYLIFEMVPINYRPVLIEGVLEASYPSSTTLLTLSVMLSLMYQANHRSSNYWLRKGTNIFSVLFSFLLVQELPHRIPSVN